MVLELAINFFSPRNTNSILAKYSLNSCDKFLRFLPTTFELSSHFKPISFNLLSANSTISIVPGDLILLNKALATSSSGEIIASIGKFLLS